MKQRGFTLLELMVVVTLMAIMVTLVGPSMRELIAVQRVKSIHAELVTDLQFARSEATRIGRPVLMRFQTAADMGCYVIYSEAGMGNCDCTRAPGAACQGGFQEIKTVQVPTSLGVSLAASSATDTIVSFDQRSGMSDPGDFRIDLASNLRGALRATVNAAGRPGVCSPDGSIKQVPHC
jgi:type IV fimbrial biogenesis protein FimT